MRRLCAKDCGEYKVEATVIPPQALSVIPHLVLSRAGKVSVVVRSSSVVGVCLSDLQDIKLDGATLQGPIHTGTWVTTLRDQDNAYFLPPSGLLPFPNGATAPAPDIAAVHMAIEVSLATWPEWGGALRGHFLPLETVPLGFPQTEIHA